MLGLSTLEKSCVNTLLTAQGHRIKDQVSSSERQFLLESRSVPCISRVELRMGKLILSQCVKFNNIGLNKTALFRILIYHSWTMNLLSYWIKLLSIKRRVSYVRRYRGAWLGVLRCSEMPIKRLEIHGNTRPRRIEGIQICVSVIIQ